MKRLLVLFVPALVVVGVLLVAGVLPTAGSDAALPAGVSLALQATPTAPPPADSADMTGASSDETEPLLPTPIVQPDDNCLNCHSDAELLQELAVEPEVVEVPSEGSG
ncbi:MAG: hypothetical protein JW910_22975 [Anaerolineae bacterium]|nr:hypothetical protein [Anaerolineae bacterium]